MYETSIRALLRYSIRKLNGGYPSLLLGLAAQDVKIAFPGDNSWSTMYRPTERGRECHATHRGIDECRGFGQRFVEEKIQFVVEDILVNGPPWNTRIALRLHDYIEGADSTDRYNHLDPARRQPSPHRAHHRPDRGGRQNAAFNATPAAGLNRRLTNRTDTSRSRGAVARRAPCPRAPSDKGRTARSVHRSSCDDGSVGNDPMARVDRLERDVARLELEIRELRARLARSERAPAPAARWAPPVATPPVATPTGETPPVGAPAWHEPAGWPNPAQFASPQQARPLVLKSETILKWGGIGLVVLAVGFAVSTAISRGWIGPELQLAGALLVSLGLIAAGLRVRARRVSWTHALCSGGVLALFTTFASDLFLDQTSDTVAFVATAASGLMGFALTWTIRSEWTGAATLLGGAVGWMVIADGELPLAASAAWFGASIALALIVSVDRKMPALRFAAHATGLVLVLALAEVADHRSEQIAALAIAALLFGSLVRLPSLGDMVSVWQQLEIQLTIAAAPWAFSVIAIMFEIEGDRSVGWTAISVALGTALVGLAVERWISAAHFVSLLIGAGVALTIGIAVLLSTTAAFMAIAVQGAGLVLLSRVFDREIRVLVNGGVLLVVATNFALGNMIAAWTDDAPVGDDIAHATIVASLAVAAWLTGVRQIQQVMAASTLALMLVWLGSVLVHLPQGQAVVSVSWALIGIAVLIVGAIRKMPGVGAAGLAVIGITVGKLLTVDLREVDTLWRAGLFLVIGLGLMRIGFLLPRFARDDETADGPTPGAPITDGPTPDRPRTG